ncbi:MAG: class A beta-lactamase-related serine hydrolase, partial [Sphingobacteriales bacterium]
MDSHYQRFLFDRPLSPGPQLERCFSQPRRLAFAACAFSTHLSPMRFFFILLLGAALPAAAQPAIDTVARIRAIFARYNASEPGSQFAVSRGGTVLFSGAWGVADLEQGTPLTTGTLIETGSVAKQFTAAAILLLEQQGKLSLQDDVRRYLPELPDYGAVVRVRH